MIKYDADVFEKPYKFVKEWYSLAAVLEIRTQTLAYILKAVTADEEQALSKKYSVPVIEARDRTIHYLTKKITLPGKKKKRVVYDSAPILKKVQNKLILFFKALEDQIEGDFLLSYRQGINPSKVLQKVTGKKLMVHFDVKKFYDFVTYKQIVKTLKEFGVPHSGAKLIARFCVVQRFVGGKVLSTLQQGSPCSPTLSNLVGYTCFDKPILEWVSRKREQFPDLELQYYRYCDNSVLFFDKEIPEGLASEYKEFVKSTLQEQNFGTHKWATVTNNHPKMNQKFLGIVLNEEARIEKEKFFQIRATLFNACRSGISIAANQYFANQGRCYDPPVVTWSIPSVGSGEKPYTADHIYDMETVKFVQVMRGHIAYAGGINEKHKTQLTKLLRLAQFLGTVKFYSYFELDAYHKRRASMKVEEKNNKWVMIDGEDQRGNPTFITQDLKESFFTLLKSYKNNKETVDQFMERAESLAKGWV